MNALNIFALWLSGVFLGVGLMLYIIEDTGARCLSMYENPEDQSECVWILNNKN
jgi:hypothetical protein